MKWYDSLYVSESIGKKANRIKWKINHNAGTLSVYVIAFASNRDNLLDIIPARELLQKAYPKKDLHIIGLAGGYDEALALAARIISETYRDTGDTDVYRYLKENRRKSL